MTTRLLVLSATLLSLAACEERTSGIKLGAVEAEGCDLSIDRLAGTEWVMLRINPDKSETPDPKARLRFFEEGGALKAKYNVASVADMYTYDCVVNQERGEVVCKEPPKVKDWCQALVAGGAEDCTYDAIKKIEPSVGQAQFDEGYKQAHEVMDRLRGDEEKWAKFVFQNNNLGNKLRGILYASVDKRFCRLRVTDNYMTIYNGKRVEDSNPVGTNPFVKNELGELLWEHCENREDLIARPEADYPEDPDKIGHLAHYTVGQPIHVWYLAEDGRYYEEGCEHRYDVWLNARPYKKDLKPEIVDGKKGRKELRWHVELSFDRPSETKNGEVVTFVRYTKCADGKEKKAVSCAALLIE